MALLTSNDCLKRYGQPSESNPCMVLWDIPANLEIGMIPRRLYCNRDMVGPLTQAFTKLIQTGHVSEIKTWDGCFNIRKIRGRTSMSLHSWGCAIDMNASTDCLGCQSHWSPGFVECFTSSGLNWGGNFISRKDPMHFELAK